MKTSFRLFTLLLTSLLFGGAAFAQTACPAGQGTIISLATPSVLTLDTGSVGTTNAVTTVNAPLVAATAYGVGNTVTWQGGTLDAGGACWPTSINVTAPAAPFSFTVDQIIPFKCTGICSSVPNDKGIWTSAGYVDVDISPNKGTTGAYAFRGTKDVNVTVTVTTSSAMAQRQDFTYTEVPDSLGSGHTLSGFSSVTFQKTGCKVVGGVATRCTGSYQLVNKGHFEVK